MNTGQWRIFWRVGSAWHHARDVDVEDRVDVVEDESGHGVDERMLLGAQSSTGDHHIDARNGLRSTQIELHTLLDEILQPRLFKHWCATFRESQKLMRKIFGAETGAFGFHQALTCLWDFCD